MKSKTPATKFIDRRVTLTMIATSLLAFIIVGFRYHSYEPSLPVAISVSGDRHTGKFIKFSVGNLPGKKVMWDFGDKSLPNSHGNIGYHAYNKPGRYNVTVTIDNKYNSYASLYIARDVPVMTQEIRPQFFSPATAIVNKPITCKDSTPGAVSWEWRFGETNTVDARVQQPTYTFKETGWKSISLIVNNKIMGERSIYVDTPATKMFDTASSPRAAKDTAIKKIKIIKKGSDTTKKDLRLSQSTSHQKTDSILLKKAPELSAEQIQDSLLDTVDRKKNPSGLSVCFAFGMNTMVKYNGQLITLESSCSRLKREYKKSRNIKSLVVADVIKDEHHLIITMSITITKNTAIQKVLKKVGL